ncbi:MAG: DnaJ domain-containing protein [bacterium]|nr:DnaJ domain-containing protein [bacterium]
MCQTIFWYLVIYGVIWGISKLFSTSRSDNNYSTGEYSSSGSSDDHFNYSQRNNQRNYGDSSFISKIKPLIMCSAYILAQCNVQTYLRKNILQEMYGKNVQYRKESLDLIEEIYMNNTGFIKYYTETIKKNFNYGNRLKYLRNQIKMLNNIKRLNQDSVNVLYQITMLIGLSSNDLIMLLNEIQFSGYSYNQNYRAQKKGKDPYAELGLNPGASLEEVKDAYIKLVSKYHPDRYLNRGESEKKQAEEKMKDINVAYQQIRKNLDKKSSQEYSWRN